jgi:chromosome segregation ATPase
VIDDLTARLERFRASLEASNWGYAGLLDEVCAAIAAERQAREQAEQGVPFLALCRRELADAEKRAEQAEQERDRLQRRVNALEAAMNPQDVAAVDAALSPQDGHP